MLDDLTLWQTETFTHYLIKSNILLINDGATKITILSSIVSCLHILGTPAPTIYGIVCITRVDTLHLPSCNFLYLVTNLLMYFLFIFHLKAITMLTLLLFYSVPTPLIHPSRPLPQFSSHILSVTSLNSQQKHNNKRWNNFKFNLFYPTILFMSTYNNLHFFLQIKN